MTDDTQPGQIGRYRILKPLGQGAMATVYLAELATLGGFRRKVALKVVRDEFARDAKFGQLMAREAMIGSLLQHPCIVETLEFNEADGRMFLALEFVEGQTVEELIKQAKSEGRPSLSLKHSLEITIQVLQGLSYAHCLETDEGKDVGIVHRDLKPGNIMVSRHGQVKVMDFGIAKAKVAMATITAAGQVRGTPIYMAPEQVTGQALDGRADQFAAATVLYEMLTGKQVFIARNLIEIMRAVSRADVAEPLRVVSALHPALTKIMGKMWERSREDRYVDCDAAALDLREVLVLEQRKEMTLTPVPADPPPKAKSKSKSSGARGARKKRKKEPEKRGGMFDLVAALGFGRKKAKPDPPPKKKRRKKRRNTTGGARRPSGAGSSGAISEPRAARQHASEEEPVMFLDDTTFGENTDEQGLVIPPTAPMPVQPAASSAGPARLGPETTPPAAAVPSPAAEPTPKPPAEPAPEPRVEPAPEPRVEPAPEPRVDPAPEPPRRPEPEAAAAEPAGPSPVDPDTTVPPDPPPQAETTAPPSRPPSQSMAIQPPAPPQHERGPQPFDVPTAAGLKARTDLLITDDTPTDPPKPIGRPADSLGPTDLPSSPALRAAPELLVADIGPAKVDLGDLPTPAGLAPRSLSGDSFDAPTDADVEPESAPTPLGLMPEPLVASAAAGPFSGPTRPMQVVDVRAALAAEEQPTARMDSNPGLLSAENDMKTRPMAVQHNIAELLGKPVADLLTVRPSTRQSAAPDPAPEDEPTAADTPAPDGEGLPSGELDPFFFED